MSVITQTDSASARVSPYPYWFTYDPTSADLDIVDTYGMPAAEIDILTANSSLVCKCRRTDSAQIVVVPTVANGAQVPFTIRGRVSYLVKAATTTTSVIVYLPEVPKL